MHTDIIRSKITSGIRTHSPTNICYKTRTHRPLTTKQINRCTHPLNSLLKLVQKVSPAKSPDTKNKENKCNLQLYLLVTLKTKEILTAKLMKLQHVNE